jgi:autotransporter translocation and assembly factor TamB
MRFTLLTLLVVSLVAAPATARAQSVDPSGHWEGAITIPGSEIPFQVDLSKNAQGKFVATYSRPENNLNGLPLANVSLDGRAINFELTVDGSVKFYGTVNGDGTTIAGDVTARLGNAAFSMRRTGDARIAAAPKNAPIGKDLEGTWNGTLSLQGTNLRLVLRMVNDSDGTASGTIVSVDQGGIEFPLALTQKASSLTLSTPAIGGDFYTGSLTAAGELAGTFSQGPVTAPLTFVRSK